MIIGYMATNQGQRKLDLLLQQRDVQHTTAMIACIMKNNTRNKTNCKGRMDSKATSTTTATFERIPSTIGLINEDADTESSTSYHSEDDESHIQEQDNHHQRRRRTSTLLFDESNRGDEEALFGEIGW